MKKPIDAPTPPAPLALELALLKPLPTMPVPPEHLALMPPTMAAIAERLPELTAEERLANALVGARGMIASVLFMGHMLRGMKESLGHGSYCAALAQRGIPRSSAWDAVSVVRTCEHVPPANVRALGHLEISKLRLMVTWAPDEIEGIFQGDEIRGVTLEDLQTESLRDLQKKLHEASATEKRLRKNLQAANQAVADKDRELAALKRAHSGMRELPAEVERCRVEAQAQGRFTHELLDRIDGWQRALIEGRGLSSTTERRREELRAGAVPLYALLRSFSARAESIAREMRESYGERYLPDDPPLLSPAEARAALARYDHLRATLDHELQALLATEVPHEPKRGRPKGSRNRRPAKTAPRGA
ncbi:MAG: hypothetical protein IT495_17090 [Gammaproteobacteria bacterium]|nr:hypothetical protein [Gammaproteobacteria bacterium]